MSKRLFSAACLVLVLVAQPFTAGAESQDDPGFLFALAQLFRFQGFYDDALKTFEQAAAADAVDPFVHLEFGEFLFQIGKLERAAQQVERARQSMPSNREALRLNGRIELRRGERSAAALDRASDIFEQLRALDPLDIDVRVTLGRLHLNRSRPGPAAEVLREAHEMRPGDRLIGSLLVEALSGIPPESSVLEELRELIAGDPKFLQPRLALARALSSAGEQQQVVELLEEAPDSVRSNVDYLKLLAFAYYRIGQLDSSLEVNDLWLSKRPSDTMGRYLKSLTLTALGRGSEAEEILKALLEQEPSNGEFAMALAELVERQGRPYEAAQLLRTLLDGTDDGDASDQTRRVRGLLADVYARAGEWEQLLSLVTETIDLNQGVSQPGLRLLRIRALKELGRHAEALAELESLRPVSALEQRMAANRAELLYLLDRPDDADKVLETLTSGDEVEGLMMAAEVLHELDFFERAIPILTRAEALEPRNLEITFWLGATYERSNDIDRAESTFRRLLSLDGDFAPALNYLGYMWADRGSNLQEALALVQKAVALDPNNGAYLDSLGWAYFKSGRLQEAREPLERASELVRNDPIVFEHLGDLYAATGRAEAAKAAYEKALALGAENPDELKGKLQGILDW